MVRDLFRLDLTRVVWLEATVFVIAGLILLRASDFMRAGSVIPETDMDGEVQPVPASY